MSDNSISGNPTKTYTITYDTTTGMPENIQPVETTNEAGAVNENFIDKPIAVKSGDMVQASITLPEGEEFDATVLSRLIEAAETAGKIDGPIGNFGDSYFTINNNITISPRVTFNLTNVDIKALNTIVKNTSANARSGAFSKTEVLNKSAFEFSGFVDKLIGRGINVTGGDVEALIEYVLRESYMQTTEDLRFFAEKVKFFNAEKKAIRAHMAKLREISSALASVPEDERGSTDLNGDPTSASSPNGTTPQKLNSTVYQTAEERITANPTANALVAPFLRFTGKSDELEKAIKTDSEMRANLLKAIPYMTPSELATVIVAIGGEDFRFANDSTELVGFFDKVIAAMTDAQILAVAEVTPHQYPNQTGKRIVDLAKNTSSTNLFASGYNARLQQALHNAGFPIDSTEYRKALKALQGIAADPDGTATPIHKSYYPTVAERDADYPGATASVNEFLAHMKVVTGTGDNLETYLKDNPDKIEALLDAIPLMTPDELVKVITSLAGGADLNCSADPNLFQKVVNAMSPEQALAIAYYSPLPSVFNGAYLANYGKNSEFGKAYQIKLAAAITESEYPSANNPFRDASYYNGVLAALRSKRAMETGVIQTPEIAKAIKDLGKDANEPILGEDIIKLLEAVPTTGGLWSHTMAMQYSDIFAYCEQMDKAGRLSPTAKEAIEKFKTSAEFTALKKSYVIHDNLAVNMPKALADVKALLATQGAKDKETAFVSSLQSSAIDDYLASNPSGPVTGQDIFNLLGTAPDRAHLLRIQAFCNQMIEAGRLCPSGETAFKGLFETDEVKNALAGTTPLTTASWTTAKEKIKPLVDVATNSVEESSFIAKFSSNNNQNTTTDPNQEASLTYTAADYDLDPKDGSIDAVVISDYPPFVQVDQKRKLNTCADLDAELKSLEDKLNTVGDDAQLANVDLQNSLQKQQQTLTMMSNIYKMFFDTGMNTIRKIGG
ncbi:MAG: hypothetical protein JW841_17740 [Deltaproteobacteria bacterium]|nr:hypothetical protein [Deltaproteobacteria bacterium]